MRHVSTPYRVSRTIRIEAPPAVVHPHVADLRRWAAWSPWEGRDPHLERTYTGPEQGVGAGYAWSGNKDAGEGSVLVTLDEEPARVELALRFEEPFPADNHLRLDLDPESGGRACVVSWTMTGQPTGLLRMLARMLPMDRMVGKELEKGLNRLKRQVEGRVRAQRGAARR